jgi:hypothetical protein
MTDLHIDLTINEKKYQIPLTRVHTIVLGSGAAGLNAAVSVERNIPYPRLLWL